MMNIKKNPMLDINKNPFLAPLRFFRLPFHKQIFYILEMLFALWIMMSVPSGWIYDLGLKTGTEQGQKPDQFVQMVHMQDEVEDFYFQDTPATVSKNNLIQCPLMRLRDSRFSGKFVDSDGVNDEFSEYIPLHYPLNHWDKVSSRFMNAYYNIYYLAPLEDGTYVCVYFDDYLLLRSGQQLHTGYVRNTTTEEKIMLHKMAKNYNVNPVYVLDMYRYGKCHWILETLIRLFIVILVLMKVSSLLKRSKKEEKAPKKEVKTTKEEQKFALKENEIIVRSGQIYSMHMKMNGTIYVTNQRVCFVGNITGYLYMNLSLSEIAGYDTWSILLTRSVTIYDIYDTKHMRYQYTGLAVKKLPSWLEQVGIRKLE